METRACEGHLHCTFIKPLQPGKQHATNLQEAGKSRNFIRKTL